MSPDDGDDGAPRERLCLPRHIICFFMCFDVERRMAIFMWLVAALSAEIVLYFAARTFARAQGFMDMFSAWHLVPLLLIAGCHFFLLGLKPEDRSSRATTTNIDPVMLRILFVTLLAMAGVSLALSLCIDKWWSDPMSLQRYLQGPPPEHATPSPTHTPGGGSGLLPIWKKTPTPTPSHTPTSSPDPRILMAQFEHSSDMRSIVGMTYMGSVLAACASVICNYNLRMVTQA